MARKKEPSLNVPKTGEKRKEFVQRYVSAHPKLSVDAARTRANKIFRVEGGPQSYPKLTHALKEEGLTEYQARKFSKQFKELNKEKYRRQLRPPLVRDIMTGKMKRMPAAQIQAEWLDDFRDLYGEIQEEFGVDFREAYREEA